jgi:hypothetical protein
MFERRRFLEGRGPTKEAMCNGELIQCLVFVRIKGDPRICGRQNDRPIQIVGLQV